jgi:hypothetical protein
MGYVHPKCKKCIGAISGECPDSELHGCQGLDFVEEIRIEDNYEENRIKAEMKENKAKGEFYGK